MLIKEQINPDVMMPHSAVTGAGELNYNKAIKLKPDYAEEITTWVSHSESKVARRSLNSDKDHNKAYHQSYQLTYLIMLGSNLYTTGKLKRLMLSIQPVYATAHQFKQYH